ncbi:MAG TPA: ABC transporter permease [Methylomirabilota bacterium]|jgi:peptide/nickel transport system permease protein|nr:ABC transporter permease [Methylomirabilota bacterium]
MRYLARRALWTVVALLGVSVLIFLLVRLLPGNIVDIIAGTEGQLSREQRTAVLREFGLDRPVPVQYALWLRGMLRGDLGWSFRSGQPVAQLLVSRLPVTIELALLTVLGVTLVGIPLGVLASVSRSMRVKTGVQIVGLLGLSVPSFWIAVLLIITASHLFGWLPALIFVSPWSDPWVNLQQMFLPVLSLALGLSVVVVRMTRSSMLEVLGQDFVKVARAKGLSARAVLLRHALRNALIPIVTVLGLQMGYLLGGVVITEQIFGLPGLGWTLLNGVYQRDYPVVQATVMLFAVTFVVINLGVDLLYTYLDPRIRYE